MKLAKELLILISFLNILYAESVTAGTRIKNTATLHYRSNLVNYSVLSNEIEDRIAQLVDIQLEWLDDDPVMVTSGDQAKVLHFRLTNLGNAYDQFSLLLIDQESSVFTVENLKLVKDVDGDGLYDPSVDQVVDTMGLKSGESVELLAVADIPKLDKASIGYATQTLAVRSKAPTDSTSEIPVVKKRAMPVSMGCINRLITLCGHVKRRQSSINWAVQYRFAVRPSPILSI